MAAPLLSPSDNPSRMGPVAVAVLGLVGLVLTAGCNGLAARGMNAEGVRLFQQSRNEEAIERFYAAINTDPNDADGYYNVAAVRHYLGKTGEPGKTDLANKDLEQAEHYYRMCLQRDPGHHEAHRGLAVLLVETERSQEAFDGLKAWAESQPLSPEPKIELARLYEEFGDRETALARLQEAVKVDPDNSRAFAALGRLQEAMGDPAQALRDYERSHSYDPRQQEVAARIADLRARVASGATAPLPNSSGDTRIVTGPANTVR